MSASIVELGVVVVVGVVSVSLLVYFNNANVKSYNTCVTFHSPHNVFVVLALVAPAAHLAIPMDRCDNL